MLTMQSKPVTGSVSTAHPELYNLMPLQVLSLLL